MGANKQQTSADGKWARRWFGCSSGWHQMLNGTWNIIGKNDANRSNVCMFLHFGVFAIHSHSHIQTSFALTFACTRAASHRRGTSEKMRSHFPESIRHQHYFIYIAMVVGQRLDGSQLAEALLQVATPQRPRSCRAAAAEGFPLCCQSFQSANNNVFIGIHSSIHPPSAAAAKAR
jgi:hypothetical protein